MKKVDGLDRVALDLDGTLYDSFETLHGFAQKLWKENGYETMDRETYRNNFQTRDFRKLYGSFGIPEHDIDRMIQEFVRRVDEIGHPELIIGAKEFLFDLDKHDIETYIISNDNSKRIKKRFTRDNLTHLLPNVRNPFDCKAEVLYELANVDPEKVLPYVGDLASDGFACLKARVMGAKNIRFYAILHDYSMNSRHILQEFVDKHSDFSESVEDIGQLSEKILNF